MNLLEITVYPVKGLRGVPLEASEIEPAGLRDDRRWMLVDGEGRFLSQRNTPQMARLAVWRREGTYEVHRAGGGAIELPDGEGAETEVTVWRDRMPALGVSPEVDRWFSEALGQDCRLVQALPETGRRSSPRYGDAPVRFSDAAPILVVSQASLDHLNGRLEKPVPMDRFRANLVISAAEAHAEDGWPGLQIGDVRLRRSETCGRCLVITTDQQTGERFEEPLRTLATYRTVPRADGGSAVIFGTYYVPMTGGTVRAGDAVALLSSS